MGTEVLQEKDISVFISQLKSIFYGFFNFFRRYDAWAFTNSSERTLVDGKYKDRLFDPIGETGKLKLLIVELRLFQKYSRRNVASKYVVSRSFLLFIEEFYLRIFLRKVDLEGNEVLKEIEKELGISVNEKQIIRKYLAQYRVMQLLLKIAPNPKVVFLSVSYANFGYIQAWKERGIKVVEFQHGLIGSQHSGYLYYKKMNSIQFPDDIVVFGENEMRFFDNKTAVPITKAVPIGRYIIDYYSKKSRENSEKVKTVSVALQDSEWSFALLDFVFECNKATNGSINWLIQTRRTPITVYKEKYDFPANMQFHELTIYDAIGKTDVHLTIFSTTSVEALSLGKPCLLYDFEKNATNHLHSMIGNNKFVHFLNNANEFVSYIENYSSTSLSDVARSNIDNINSDYSENLNVYLTKLVDEVSEA